MFEIVDGRTTDAGRRIHGYPISSPCEPKGSGELKKKCGGGGGGRGEDRVGGLGGGG